jgi:hypothetical protein|tara:strand:+ start:359 stop:550 length:192 start_codon:yes stop_codon:yes gene_type:complete
MTQYLNEVLHGRQRLGEEELDKVVKSLYVHKTTEENYSLTSFASGRSVKQFADKRRKDEVSYG